MAELAGALWGWSPDAFWRATPDEVAAMVEVVTGEQAEAADGGVLARLRERYPDG